ncbi:MAG: T9SS type A sorting domain-containing protein [Bacteroidia bacterium]|nr:T9SS type A sorting domain-containing protein [Bacteroidia bacterium]
MNPIKSLFLLSVCLVVQLQAFSQCVPDAGTVLETNQVKATFYNGSDMWWDLVGNPAYEVPKNQGKHSAFAAGIWMGGLDANGGLHVAASTYRQSGVDYAPGPFRTTGNYQCDTFIDGLNQPLKNGLLNLPSGKTLILADGGYSVYDYKTNLVTQHTLTNPKSNYRAVLLSNGKVMLVGDNISSYPNPDPVSLIDTTTFNNTSGITLNHFHVNSSVTALNNGKILICGLNGTELYDPVTNTSTSVAGPATPRQGHSAIGITNGKVLIAGGTATSLTTTFGSKLTDIFDPATNSWTAGPQMLVNRYLPVLAIKSNGRVIVLGGENTTNYTNSIGLIDPVGLTYNVVGNLPGPYSFGNSAYARATGYYTTPSEFLLIGNGEMGFLDPATYQFTLLQNRTVGPEGALLNDGKVLTQAGLNSMEFRLFNPFSREFEWGNWQKIWQLSKSQIAQFQADFANNSVNYSNYPDILTWPAHGSVAAGEDFHLAPFQDVNGDGKYIPGWSGDYPCIAGDEALFYIFNDDAVSHTETGGDKLGVQVEAMIYAYDCSGGCADSALDFTTFYHYDLVNKSGNDYRNFYFGQWVDSDIGTYSDDYVGCDTNLNLGFAYNGAPNDAGSTGYGLNPPALGSVVLNSPDDIGMGGFVYYENDFSMTGNPEMASHYYGYLTSRWKDGTHLVNNGQNGYSGTASGPSTNYIFSGDAGFCGGSPSGWSEVSAGNQPFDRRFLLSVGPIDLAAGDTLSYDFAVIWSRGYYNDNLGSVCELKKDAASITNWWQSQNNDCFHLSVGRDKTPSISAQRLDLFPNPARNAAEIQLGSPLQQNALLTLTNALGAVIHQENLPAGRQLHQLDLSALPGGIYIVNLQNETLNLSRKLVVNR